MTAARFLLGFAVFNLLFLLIELAVNFLEAAVP
jgi:hypothetical protein